jgi:D-hydroxyproline dehydrogenase subunit alpha
VAVVGAGPAGMAAALAAADLGAQVVLIDAGRTMGGQIYRRPATASAAALVPVGPKMPKRLRRLEGLARVRHLPGVVVWQAVRVTDGTAEVDGGLGADGSLGAGGGLGTAGSLRPAGSGGFRLWLSSADGSEAARGEPDQVVAGAVVVATGASEVVLPFPGWELPGVTTVGAAQALLKGQGVSAGRRVLVAGSGPLLLPAAAGLAQAGVEVIAVLEANPVTAGTLIGAARLASFTRKAAEAAAYGRILARHRVPVRAGYAVTAAHGDGEVSAATVSRVDRDWRPIPGTGRRVAVDAVHVSFGFSPGLELTRALGCADLPVPGRAGAVVWCDDDQATSVPGVFAAGETTGVAGAEVAELEGYLAGAGAVRYLESRHAAFGINNKIYDPEVGYGRRGAGPGSDGHGAGPGSDGCGAGLRAVGGELDLGRIRGALARARAFARGLDGLYPWRDGWLDWPDEDTVVCRCEEVRWSAIAEAVGAGARDVRAVKGASRCGMGYCQGRVCGPAVQQAVAGATGRGLGTVGDLGARPIAAPVSLGTIAGSA